MDAEIKKEQIGTTFVRVGPVVGPRGVGGWGRGPRPRIYTWRSSDFFYLPEKNIKLNELLIAHGRNL
jgi:hypothetical protein